VVGQNIRDPICQTLGLFHDNSAPGWKFIILWGTRKWKLWRVFLAFFSTRQNPAASGHTLHVLYEGLNLGFGFAQVL